MKESNRIWFSSLLIALNIAADQVTKYFARSYISYSEIIPIIKGHFTLLKVENTGAFLSLGDNLPQFVKIIILTGFPLIVLAYGMYHLYTQKLSMITQIGFCFLIGGGFGNIYDRILHGSVTDFMHMDFIIFQTGVFNVADISIMIGIGLLLLETFNKGKQTLN